MSASNQTSCAILHGWPAGGRISGPNFFAVTITHRKDAVYLATMVGGASVKLFLPIFKMNFPGIVDIALPAEGVFHNLVFVSIKKPQLRQERNLCRTCAQTNLQPHRGGIFRS